MTQTGDNASFQAGDRDLSSLERMLNRQRWSSGLLDVFAGGSIVLIGLLWLADQVVFGALIPVLAFSFWGVAQRKLVEPRSGYVETGERRRGIERKSLSLLLLLGMVLFIQVAALIAIRPDVGAPLSRMSELLAPGIPTFLLALLVFTGGLLVDQRRGVVYGLFMVNAGVAGGLLGLAPGTIMVFCGGVVLIVGTVLLRRFLDANPVMDAA